MFVLYEMTGFFLLLVPLSKPILKEKNILEELINL